MADDIRYLNELFRIINGALRLDLSKVRNYASFLADKLEGDGDTNAATRLRKLLQETSNELKPADLSVARTLPVDSESRFPLLERVPVRELEEAPIFLDCAQEEVAQEFLSVAKCHAQLDARDIPSSLSLLMYGPPGCGKSKLARHIARELGLELYIARLDGVISSYLGSTAKNIRALFEFASRTPCVLFLDEFDAIAKLRGDAHDLGELKRVVNSFIQNLDTVGKQSIVIAATNHEELLDSAVWRRFIYRIEFGYPNAEIRARLWAQYLPGWAFGAKDLEVLVDLSEGFSGSDIEDVCIRLRRRQVTQGSDPSIHDAFMAIQNISMGEGEHRRFVSNYRFLNPDEIANELRSRDSKVYSHAVIARLLNVSKPTAHRWTKEGGTNGRKQQS